MHKINVLAHMFEFAEGMIEKLEPIVQELRSVAARSGLPEIWLRHVRDKHSSLTSISGSGSRLALNYIFVPLHLAEETGKLKTDEGSKEVPGELRRFLENSTKTGNRWVVKGEPGSGKTTLLRYLAFQLANEEAPRWLPIFERLPNLIRREGWFLNKHEDELEKSGEPAQGLAAWLDQQGSDGRLLVLLDGLDEVPRDNREECEIIIRKLALKWPKSPIVVTSRPIGYEPLGPDFVELRLLPLDRERQKELLGRRFGGVSPPDLERAVSALDVLDSEQILQELARIPLFLTLIAWLIERDELSEINRAEVYRHVFKLLVRGAYRPELEPIDNPDGTLRVLRRIAWTMTEENRDADTVEAIEARLYRPDFDDVRKILQAVPRWGGRVRSFLEDVSERTGILGPHDGQGSEWRFLHPTFREALAAEELLNKGESKTLKHAEEIAGDESRWAELYALVTSQVKDPDALILALFHKSQALGLRALGTAQNLKDRTFNDVLELTKVWQDRARVYERIPEVVNDPEHALALIDSLRRQTYDGNDLYFLFQSAEEIATRSRRGHAVWTRLSKTFFDHIPKPSEELFLWIERGDGIRIKLWCDIPQGSFMMGSPDREDGRYRDEGPQIEMTLDTSFAMAAVPVTVEQFKSFDSRHCCHHQELVSDQDLAKHPVERVTWFKATSFCRWLSASFDWAHGARLPSEPEWEYACRACSTTRFWSGDSDSDLSQVGWYFENSGNVTHRVCDRPPNCWGLYDVHGNVGEWTASPWSFDYSNFKQSVTPTETTLDAARVPPLGGGRVLRGGSFANLARHARSACRIHGDPGHVIGDQGFRVLLPAIPKPLR